MTQFFEKRTILHY